LTSICTQATVGLVEGWPMSAERVVPSAPVVTISW
jgi:hypothetical protein